MNPTDEPRTVAWLRGRNVRAARAYADLNQAAMAHALGRSVNTFKRIEAGEREATADELVAIAERCGVPLGFLYDGFAGSAVGEMAAGVDREFQLAVLDRLDKITNALAAFHAGHDMIAQAFAPLVAQDPEAANGILGRAREPAD
jgi:transcriptional regulator with XRE-family HTH domain